MEQAIISDSDIYFSVLTKEHIQSIKNYLNHQKNRFRRYIPDEFDKPILFDDDILKLLTKINEPTKMLTLGLFVADTNQLIGHASFNTFWDAHAGSFEIVMHPDYWYKGIGLKASSIFLNYVFENHVVHNISMYIEENNEEGRKLASKLGFTRCGLIRRSSFRNGSYINTIVFDILRPEWLNRRS